MAIIWFDEGKTETQIADLLFISVRNVRRWIRYYRENRILGLHDGERTGDDVVERLEPGEFIIDMTYIPVKGHIRKDKYGNEIFVELHGGVKLTTV